MNERDLIEKLRRIQALRAGATTDGEAEAARRAMARVLTRLEKMKRADPPVEYRFTIHDPWSRRLFLALCRRYGLDPYRRYAQKRQTIMVRVPRRFVDQTLWPEFEELNDVLHGYLDDITRRVISEGVHGDSAEARVVRQIGG